MSGRRIGRAELSELRGRLSERHNLSAFVGGNMSMGVYGDDLFLRLSEGDRAELLKVKGAALFEPMKGRQMKEYVVVPRSWTKDPRKIKPWVKKSLEWSSKLPPKKPKKR